MRKPGSYSLDISKLQKGIQLIRHHLILDPLVHYGMCLGIEIYPVSGLLRIS